MSWDSPAPTAGNLIQEGGSHELGLPCTHSRQLNTRGGGGPFELGLPCTHRRHLNTDGGVPMSWDSPAPHSSHRNTGGGGGCPYELGLPCTHSSHRNTQGGGGGSPHELGLPCTHSSHRNTGGRGVPMRWDSPAPTAATLIPGGVPMSWDSPAATLIQKGGPHELGLPCTHSSHLTTGPGVGSYELGLPSAHLTTGWGLGSHELGLPSTHSRHLTTGPAWGNGDHLKSRIKKGLFCFLLKCLKCNFFQTWHAYSFTVINDFNLH